MAKKIPGKEEFHETLRYFQVMLEKYKVDIKLNTTFDSSMADKYDKVILATGIIPRKPKIKGIDHSKVVGYIDVLNNKVNIGSSVALIGAGGIGFDVAEYLSHKWRTLIGKDFLIYERVGGRYEFLLQRGIEGIKPHISKPKKNLSITKKERQSRSWIRKNNWFGFIDFLLEIKKLR